jgi:methionyl-tRNA formyltransferase
VTDRPRQVVLMGKGDLAARIAGWFIEAPDWDLVLVVPVVPEPAWTASLREFADQNHLSVVRSGDYRDIPPDLSIDLALSVFYDRIIKADFISRCGRILNLHNGPLPAYRGVSPINWALKNGEAMHGVTLHEVVPAVDAGAIIGQVTYSIYPDIDEVEDVYRRALEHGWTLFRQTMPLLDRIEPRTQDESAASLYTRQDDHRLGDRQGFTRAGSG